MVTFSTIAGLPREGIKQWRDKSREKPYRKGRSPLVFAINLKKIKDNGKPVGLMGISMAGGVPHNPFQIPGAAFFLQYQKIHLISHAYNFDRIIIRAIIGIIAYLILQRLPKKVRTRLKLEPELRLILG